MMPCTATAKILSMSHQLEVFRPDAILVGTAARLNVIPLQALRRTAYEKLVSVPGAATKGKSAITLLTNSAQPQGTAISPARVYLRPESKQSLFGGILCGHLKLILSGVMRAAVSAARPLNYTRKLV